VWSRRPSGAARTRSTSVDTHDVDAFPFAAWRTRIVRLVLAVSALALVLAAAVSARDLDAREEGLLPSGTTGVVVIDLSLSIEDEDYHAVRRALRRLIRENASIGLVVFSDIPYELLPPGTPAEELEPMLRLLVPPRLGPTINPWNQTFRAGTRVSSALQLARDMVERDGVEAASILLVSDLETAPDDVPALSRIVEELRRSAIELRAVALAPSSDARLLFAGLFQEGVFDAPSGPADETTAESQTGTDFPLTLFVLGGFVLLALAAHERLCGRLAVTSARSAT